MSGGDPTREVIERTVREAWGRVLATLVRAVRDIQLAEDALQDACESALGAWPESGPPERPDAWLYRAARNRAIDLLRRNALWKARRAELEHEASVQRNAEHWDMHEPIADDCLRLIFTCCHPALAEPARVALTLSTLGGLATGEIARAFLVSETTMAQRLVRAKRRIKAAGIPYRIPPPELWPERLSSVLAVLYLIFNEGYDATAGDGPTRGELCEEAIRLGRLLADLMPREPEPHGLLALMLLHDSRRVARMDAGGDLIVLEQQDRTLWDRSRIQEGLDTLHAALARRRPGPYQLQAAVSALHAQASSHSETDWDQIARLYMELHALTPSPVIALNAIVARSFHAGAEAGLADLQRMAGAKELGQYQPYHAARADLLRRAGRLDDARAAYRSALALSGNAAQRRFLQRRLESLATGRSKS